MYTMTRKSLTKKLDKKLNIEAATKATSALILEIFENSPKSIKHITSHLADAQGKGVRTELLLASSMDAEGLVPKEAVEAAASTEIFHLATLVHDDIIDDAHIRRGIESIQSKFGKKQAVICGDYLFCMAFSSIAEVYKPYTDFMPKFAAQISKICLGELEQYSNNFNLDITFYDYLKTINGKTAALFNISAHAGALIGGSSEKEIKNIARFGSYFGMIFQILDDCKDYKLNESEALKPTKNDINSGVINLPLLMSFLKEDELRQKAKYIIKNGVEINSFIEDIDRLGGVQSSVDIAKKYNLKAKKLLNQMGSTPKTQELGKLLNNQLIIMDKFR